MTLEQTLLSDINQLPDNLKQEIVHYVAYLKSKNKKNENNESKTTNDSLKKKFKKTNRTVPAFRQTTGK